MASRYSGVHTQLKRGDGGGSEVFTLVPQVSSLDGPSMDTNLLDATTVDDSSETYVYGVNKPGSVKFDLVWDPANAQHKGLLNDYVTAATRNFQIVWPDIGATVYSFAALIKNFGPKAGPKAVLTMSVELQLSGAPTLVTT